MKAVATYNSLSNLESRFPIPWLIRDNCGTAELEYVIKDEEWDRACANDPMNPPLASVHVHVYTVEQRDQLCALIEKWNTPE